MPYRRLPNTDNARFKALKKALAKGKELPPFKLAFSQSSLQRLQSFLSQFEKAMIEQKQAYNHQVEKNKEYLSLMKKAKIYISHFIQVMNMAVNRGDLPQSTRTFYGLDERNRKVPCLNSESEIIEWGEKIITGENIRVQQGLSPITNPTIAVVKVRYENFMDGYKFQKTLKKTSNLRLNKLSELRIEADKIILQVWNEIEETFKDLPEDLKREKASEYGIQYVYRKNEIGQIDFFQNTRLSIAP